MEKQYLSRKLSEDDAALGLKRILRQTMELPGGFISHLKFIPDGILINGKQVRVDYAVNAGDLLSVRIDDIGQENPATPIDCGITTVWEDEYLAVLAKPSGLAMHGPELPNHPTAANHAAFLWGREQPFHPVNRLDRDTTGLFCAAKNRLTHELLRRQLHTDSFVRVYLAVCDGVSPEAGQINAPVSGKASETAFRRLWTDEHFSLVCLRLSTGRTHQIREHMASVGHPLTGDKAYGGSDAYQGVALHSAFVSFVHPITKTVLEFAVPLPETMQHFLCQRGFSADINAISEKTLAI